MYTAVHFVLGFCPWDLLALVLLAAVVAAQTVYAVFMRRRERELEDELASLMARQALQGKPD